ncbi:hypothetical protein PAPHI01_1833 [Pancytospora philotis]|nr:hypothetical protein PAPHI01_1833 [Pancytospora philotis]
MRAWAILLLISGTAGGAGPTGSDYTDFAILGTAGLSALEKRVLDPIYKSCVGHDCPELRRLLNDGRLPRVSPNDKARGVLFMLLGRGDGSERSGLLLRLADSGYANRLLLRKLLSIAFITKLAEQREGPEGSETHQVFCRAAEHCHNVVQGIDKHLQKKVLEAHTLGLAQIAENSSGLDLAIYAAKRSDGSKSRTLSSVFSRLINARTNDAGRRARLLPVAIEFARIALQPGHFEERWQASLQRLIVKHAVCGGARSVVELFREFPAQRDLSMMVREYIVTKLGGNASARFVRNYLEYMDENYSRADKTSYKFFRSLWPSPAGFHTGGNKWRSDPDRFNLISPKWLREMFEELRANAADDPGQGEHIRRYMGMLDYDVFVRLFKPLDKCSVEGLARTMLEHQRADAANAYRQSLDRDLQDTELDKQHVKTVRVLAGVFKRLAADRLRAF